MGGNAKYRYGKKVARINADTSLSDWERETMLQDADAVYQEQRRRELLRKEQRENNITNIPKSLKYFDGHTETSTFIRKKSSAVAQKYIDEGIEYIRKAIEKHEFRTRIRESDVRKILESGRLKNQLETHTTMGADAPEDRMEMSMRVFQHDGNLKPEEYEKYGYLGNGETVAAWMYGNLDIVLKKDVMMDRTTITYGDSLYANKMASRVTDPGIASMFGMSDEYRLGIGMTVDEAEAFSRNAKKLYDTGRAWGYAELQYHGTLSLSEVVDHFSVPKTWKNNPAHEATIREIESAGFKVTYDNEK